MLWSWYLRLEYGIDRTVVSTELYPVLCRCVQCNVYLYYGEDCSVPTCSWPCIEATMDIG
jgi:hypothetical protein